MKGMAILVVIVLQVVFAQAATAAELFARLSLVDGDVQIREADRPDWLPAAVNTPVYEGDSIWSPAGARAELQLPDSTVIRLDSGSSLNILRLEDDAAQVNLGMGRAYVRTAEMERRSLQIDLPDSSVKVYDRSRFRLEITERGDEEVSVFREAAYVESYSGNTRVRTGEMLTVESGGAAITPVNGADDWDRWNAARDSSIATHDSDPRLPQELTPYGSELSTAGTWLTVREYGYVWQPTMVVSSDWAPYRYGRWVWRGGDYLWVSSEPWGWVPYHYGRWAFVAGVGWCWVPPAAGDVFWSPGYVVWVTTPTAVAWIPLAPGEVYYGNGYFGRNSVNIVNVTNVSVNVNIYRNYSRSNALTVVDRSGFISGTGKYRRGAGETFRRQKVAMGRPVPKDGAREARMPLLKRIAADKLPPRTVAGTTVEKLRERLPVIRAGGEEGRRSEQRRGTVPPVGGQENGKGRQPVANGKPLVQGPMGHGRSDVPGGGQLSGGRGKGLPAREQRPQTAPLPERKAKNVWKIKTKAEKNSEKGQSGP